MLKKFYHLNFKIIAIIILLLVLLQLSTAYIFGFIVQNELEHQFSQITQSSLIKVTKREYHRGLFSSDITTEISLNSDTLATILNLLPQNSTKSISALTDKQYSIKYTTHVEQGIFSGLFNGHFVPTLAYVKNTIIYPDSMENLLSKFFDNKPPLTFVNILYLNKSGKFLLSSPKFAYSEAVSGVKVNWGGANIEIKYNNDFDKFATDISVPDFELIAPTKGSAIFKNLIYQADSTTSVNDIKVGSKKISLDFANVEWKDKIALNIKLGDLLHMLTGINSTEFLNEIDAINPNSFSLSKVMFISNSKDENNYFSATANAQFTSLITNSRTYGPFKLDLSLEHVNSKAFAHLSDVIDTMTVESKGKDNNLTQDEFIKNLKLAFAPILVDSPLLKLNTLTLGTPDGKLDLNGFITTNNFMLSDINNQQQFLQKLKFDLNINVPQTVLSYIFILQMRYLLSAGNTQMDKQSADTLTKVVNILLDNQIVSWKKKGYLTQHNGIISSHIFVKDGKLYLNNKTSE